MVVEAMYELWALVGRFHDKFGLSYLYHKEKCHKGEENSGAENS
jgi:hypothetical protein